MNFISMKIKLTLSLFAILLSLISVNAQRNTLVIIADDLGTDYFGFYENYVDTVAVPNLRNLVRKGVRFKYAYANPVCSSTRTTILTGRYSFRTGVGNIVGSAAGSGELDTNEITIPKLLSIYNSNIISANIGKWHINSPNPSSNLLIPNIVGYHHFEGPFIGQLSSYTNWTKYTNGISSNVTNYATSENVDNAVSWIKTLNTTHPFFMWLAFNSPHEPLHLPPANLHNFINLSGTQANINANPKPYFKAMIQAMDREIGRLFDSLSVLNRLDSTDVIFIGDNGNSSRTAQIANITRAKGTIYDYGIHVPLIISGPSVVNPNRASDALVNSVDIFATVLELMGNFNWSNQIPVNKPVDAVSMMPIISNSFTQIRPWAFCEIFKNITDTSDGKAMRNEVYKLMRYDDGTEKFFNLNNDPFELNNLLDSTLSTTEIFNYNYLCTEMTNLVGSGNFCSTPLMTHNMKKSMIKVYPNPFTNRILFESNLKNLNCILYNSIGQVIYNGSQISDVDFSDLPEGFYLLKPFDNTETIKLTKY